MIGNRNLSQMEDLLPWRCLSSIEWSGDTEPEGYPGLSDQQGHLFSGRLK